MPDDSQTATFAVVKLAIDNWRWQGVPFYLRSGKAMSCRSTQIVVQFREPPHSLFAQDECRSMEGNRLVIQIQPAEGIQMHLQTKVPDAGMKMRMTDLDFRFDREFSGRLPDAYQRLLLDAAAGDASLFARSDEVELAWSIIDPILEAWNSPAAPPLEIYPTGRLGPAHAPQRGCSGKAVNGLMFVRSCTKSVVTPVEIVGNRSSMPSIAILRCAIFGSATCTSGFLSCRPRCPDIATRRCG